MFYEEHIIFYVSSALKKCKQIEMCSSHNVYTITAMSLIEEMDLKISVKNMGHLSKLSQLAFKIILKN